MHQQSSPMSEILFTETYTLQIKFAMPVLSSLLNSSMDHQVSQEHQVSGILYIFQTDYFLF